MSNSKAHLDIRYGYLITVGEMKDGVFTKTKERVLEYKDLWRMCEEHMKSKGRPVVLGSISTDALETEIAYLRSKEVNMRKEVADRKELSQVLESNARLKGSIKSLKNKANKVSNECGILEKFSKNAREVEQFNIPVWSHNDEDTYRLALQECPTVSKRMSTATGLYKVYFKPVFNTFTGVGDDKHSSLLLAVVADVTGYNKFLEALLTGYHRDVKYAYYNGLIDYLEGFPTILTVEDIVHKTQIDDVLQALSSAVALPFINETLREDSTAQHFYHNDKFFKLAYLLNLEASFTRHIVNLFIEESIGCIFAGESLYTESPLNDIVIKVQPYDVIEGRVLDFGGRETTTAYYISSK